MYLKSIWNGVNRVVNCFLLHHYVLFHSDTGNKEVMDRVQILEDYLYGVTEIREGGNLIVDSTPKEPLTVYADDYTECMEECKDR